MNRKLGQLMKAALFAVPLALPGVAFAQSAGSPPTTGTYDNADKQNAPIDKSMQDKTGAQPESSGVTGDTGDKTPPAGDLDTSGTSKDHNNAAGGDINKPSGMDTGTTTTTKTKKSTTTKKSPSDSDTGSNPGNDTH